MVKKDMKDVFLNTMSGKKPTTKAELEKNTDDNPLSLDNLKFDKRTATRKLVPVYLTDEEHEKLKAFAMDNGYTRKVRGEDALDGNLSQLMQHLASQL